MTRLTFVIVFFVLLSQVFCACIKSYAIFCESASEYNQFEVEPLSQVFIESKEVNQPPKESVNLGIFAGVISLTVIGRINHLRQISQFSCNKFIYLKTLTLYDNEIHELKNGVFPPESTIYKLSLVKNRIQTIEPKTFSEWQAKIIDLSENEIEILDSHVFTAPEFPNRTSIIILRKNKLVTLEKDTFPPTLEYLDLQENRLSFIIEDMFKKLPNLQVLNLSENKFQTVPSIRSLPSLKFFDIAQNRIRKLETKIFKRNQILKEVNFSRNQISEINSKTFSSGSSYLNFLDVSHNKITNGNFVQPLLNNSWVNISLQYNLLEFIDLEEYKGEIGRYINLNLYGNPWRCSVWTKMEKAMIKKKIQQTECDRVLFSSGNYPFCVDYSNVLDFAMYKEILINKSKKAVMSESCSWNLKPFTKLGINLKDCV